MSIFSSRSCYFLSYGIVLFIVNTYLFQLPFCAPKVVASSVENMWFSSMTNGSKPHLTKALWLGCGAAGVKVSIQHSQSTYASFVSAAMVINVVLLHNQPFLIIKCYYVNVPKAQLF